MNKTDQILELLKSKGELKQKVFENTFDAFKTIKKILKTKSTEYNKELDDTSDNIKFEYRSEGVFQCALKVAGDLLVINMHTNIFQFDRDHKIWTLPVAKRDKNSTYSGIINIYNFLDDSFKYNRVDDIGYLIARIFINNNKHYFVEGKQQMGYLSKDFGSIQINKQILTGIIESAILYSLKFDLLVPPYDEMKIINVNQIIEYRKQIKTGKRFGFSFNSDDINGTELLYTGG